LVSGTFNGIGERAGNACLEEIICALKYQYGKDLNFNYKAINELSKLVEKYSGVKLQKHKSIVGENAFCHESGIHVDGILKNPKNYENFDPHLIGRKRELVFGKHSGLAGLKYLFGERFDESEYKNLLSYIKELSIKNKSSFSESEVKKLVNGKKVFSLAY
jgi:isopropylmalate/homocitrate/citramalate synthase